jgi:heat shock protein HslJ
MTMKPMLMTTTLFSLLTTSLLADAVDLNKLTGAWHLRVLDGGEVRQARAILDFDAKRMQLQGFDGCNKVSGKLIKDNQTQTYSTELLTTYHMACREKIHTYVSKKLQKAVSEGFEIKKEERYGIEGITLKSPSHELFFKRMGKEKGWF